MFTGIIEEIGTIRSLRSIGVEQSELTVHCRRIQDDLKGGDSVAVDGVCLTVIRFSKSEAVFQLSSETMQHTLFPTKKTGDRVNLERALRLGDRLGGHIVQGHVDARATVLVLKKAGSFFEIDFSLDPAISRYIIHKGSIAVNGISLTIAELAESSFKVAIIPHTYLETTLSSLVISDRVHIETDMIGRYIERLVTHKDEKGSDSGLSEAFLREHGF